MTKKNDIPQVQIKSMNDTHSEEVVIINILLEQLNTKESFETISESFENFIRHMQHHFRSEEKLMQEMQYPSFRMHKADHDKVLNETRYAQMQWRNRKDIGAIKEYLEDEILPWLNQHIQAMDRPMADFVVVRTS